MKLPSVAAATTALFAGALAYPAATNQAPKGHEWIPAGEGDVRAPCPGLNSLANHGFLNRNGKDITIPQLIKAGKAGLGMGAGFMGAVGLLGAEANALAALSFDLDQLDHHDFPIEHDGSLSRQDRYFGQDHRLVRREYDMFMSYFAGRTHTDLQSASAARFARVNDSLANNPHVAYGPRELVLSYGETALYLQTMGMAPDTAVADLAYVRSLFQEERLPYHLGWRPSTKDITLASLGEMMLQLQLANGDSGEEDIYALTKGTYEDFLEGKIILKSVLHGLGGDLQ